MQTMHSWNLFISKNSITLLNSISEIFSRCKHIDKFLLLNWRSQSFPDWVSYFTNFGTEYLHHIILGLFQQTKQVKTLVFVLAFLCSIFCFNLFLIFLLSLFLIFHRPASWLFNRSNSLHWVWKIAKRGSCHCIACCINLPNYCTSTVWNYK